jgi:hypothetical protein
MHCALLNNYDLERLGSRTSPWGFDRVLEIYRANPAFAVARMSLASPWTAVLSDIAAVADKNAWAGYMGGGLVALERLLKMISRWQRNQQGLRERESARQLLEGHMKAVTGVRHDLPGDDHFTRMAHPDLFTDQYWQLLGRVVERMGHVKEAEIISDDDPRAAGKK